MSHETREDRLVALDAHVADCAQKLAEAERARDAFVAQHCADHPLSDALVTEMAEHVRDGRALCCESGRKWLDKRVDAVWARVLNEWAYERLSCSERRPERIEEYAQMVIERRFERRA